MSIPFVAIGSNELTEPLGPTVACRCGSDHAIEYGKVRCDDGWVESKLLAFYKCGDKTYLAGVNGMKWGG